MTSSGGHGVLKDPLIGQVVQGRYQIVRAIGKGAMGVVYEAQHLLIGRKVALKTMAAHASMSPACVQRFRREAQAAASVGNSHVVDVLDMGQLGSGSFYIVLEHLAGVDLGLAVAAERRFSVNRAVHVLCQLCDALSAVHAAGIIHRDLKPENIFLIVRDGEPDFVKVLDFGVCKFSDGDGGRLTASGDTIGTPLFMAPEQVEGRSDIDHRTDIYALGAILYFLLTGHAPFAAQTLPQLFMRICNEPAPSLRGVDSNLPVELERVVNRALSKDPKARFDSCSAFKAALLPVLAKPGHASIPKAIRADDAGLGASTGSLVRALSLRPSRKFGVRTLGLFALLVSAAAGSYLVRTPSVELAAGHPAPSAAPPVAARGPEIVSAPEPEAKASAQGEASVDVASPSVQRKSRVGSGDSRNAPETPTKTSEPDPLPQPPPTVEPPASVPTVTPAAEPPAGVPTAPPAAEPPAGVPTVTPAAEPPANVAAAAAKENLGVTAPHFNQGPKVDL